MAFTFTPDAGVDISFTPATTEHRISWFLYVEDGERVPFRKDLAGGSFGFAPATCSCGWESDPHARSVRSAVAAHKAAVRGEA